MLAGIADGDKGDVASSAGGGVVVVAEGVECVIDFVDGSEGDDNRDDDSRDSRGGFCVRV